MPAWGWILIVAAVVVWFGGCTALLGGGDTSKASATSTTRTSPRPAGTPAAAPAAPAPPAPEPVKRTPDLPAPGSAVRDGQFEFRVTAMDPPVTSIGSYQAKGEFIVLSVDITNTGKQPRSFWDDEQVLIDDQGREFANDSSAARRLGSETWESDLNPGFAISVKLVFDVPVGTVPATMEFHDSMWSGGVKVALR
ncbi:DUF4352 domain-containing protein [Nocardia higoensis]|uniref:DUF4352 domain-containing protein n=1 Tax=Nocardia higoensis TaxID=228599 RepID=A0ABS0DJ75_9NOCA|nr:DUF4352 domain-containing protein [Nocardia higoensis]MBF6358205.1 DUF4352 domain-containing protein [Nocardia higoensis]